MPITIQNNGSGNVIDVDPYTLDTGNGVIKVSGSNNIIRIARHYSCHNLLLNISGGSSVTIEQGCVIGNLTIFACDQGRICVGKGCGFNGASSILLHEPGQITLGDGCLLGGGVSIMNSDMHSILDTATGKRINWAKDVTIGDRVWIGAQVNILKGSVIGSDTVIGTATVLSGEVPGNCFAAGNPAKIIRKGISWKHEMTPKPVDQVAHGARMFWQR
jgi:acetyltransferase-like isoleucine patch superfamily enzyme